MGRTEPHCNPKEIQRQLHRAVLVVLEQKGQAELMALDALDVGERAVEATRTAPCSHWNC